VIGTLEKALLKYFAVRTSGRMDMQGHMAKGESSYVKSQLCDKEFSHNMGLICLQQ